MLEWKDQQRREEKHSNSLTSMQEGSPVHTKSYASSGAGRGSVTMSHLKHYSLMWHVALILWTLAKGFSAIHSPLRPAGSAQQAPSKTLELLSLATYLGESKPVDSSSHLDHLPDLMYGHQYSYIDLQTDFMTTTSPPPYMMPPRCAERCAKPVAGRKDGNGFEATASMCSYHISLVSTVLDSQNAKNLLHSCWDSEVLREKSGPLFTAESPVPSYRSTTVTVVCFGGIRSS